MPVRYTGPNGTEELVPAPLVQIEKSYIRDEAGEKLRPQYTFTLTGTIVNIGTAKDSPSAQSYGFADMNDILGEQERIRELFGQDYGRLEIEAPDGGGPDTIDAYCRVESINFDASTWTVRCDYTVVLTSDKIEGDTETITELDSVNETWSITEEQNGTYGISHSINAVGAPIYGAGGLQNDPLNVARLYCRDRSVLITDGGALSFYNHPSGLNLLASLTGVSGTGTGKFWNLSRSENIGFLANSWELSETFIHDPSGNAREEFSVSREFNAEDPRKIVLSINGNVSAYAGELSDLATRNNRASGHYGSVVSPNLYTRIQRYAPAGYTVNPAPLSKQLTYDEPNGQVNYTVTYQAVSGFLFSDAIEENISINDTGPSDVFAQIQIPGRTSGPLFQNMETKTAPQRTLNINIKYAPRAFNATVASFLTEYLAKPDTDALVSGLRPSAGYYYLTQNNEDWNPITRQYSRTVAWTLDTKGNSIDGMPASIRNPEL